MAAKKAPAKKADAGAKKKKPYHVYKLYEVQGDKLVRKNPVSPKAGAGSFMANHKDRVVCGKTGYMERKSSNAPQKEAKEE